MSAAEVEEFVKANDLDDGAAGALRGCSAEVLRVVLERGDLRGARNPSSALMIRIKEAKANVASTPRPASAPMGGGGGDYQDELRKEVEEFLRQNDVDERAAESLRGCLPSVQKVVLGRGDLSGARNPSSALLTRIKDARMVGPGGDDSLEAFTGATQMAGGTDASGAAMFGAGGAQLYGGACGMYGGGAMYGGGMQMGAGGDAQNGGACGMPGADMLGQPGYVKMRGLPFSAIKEDVLHFFSGFRLTTQDVVLGINSEGRPSGEAFVRFPTEQSAKDAVRERNRERMDHRYIELFPMTAIEAQRVGLPLQGGVTPTVLSACNQQATMLMAYPQLSAYGYGYMPMGAYSAYYPGFAQSTAGAAACAGQPCGFGLYGAGMGAGGCAGVYGGCAGAAGMPAAGMGACLGGCAAGGAAGGYGEATAPAAGGYGAAATGGVTGGEVRSSPY